MGIVYPHHPVKLVIGLIGKEALFGKAESLLSKKFGKTDFASKIIDFTFTDYYAQEMGECLQRQFLSFAHPIKPTELARIKLYTNRLEKTKFSERGKRALNIDPGYLTLSKLVLATTKDHQHRIYLGNGIFAEVTLRFRGKSFAKWEWTYPDYYTQDYIRIFNHIRNNLIKKKREKKCLKV